MPTDRPSRRLDRSQLPDEFSPETVRAMGMRTARLLARPGNGILTPSEQQAFNEALREVMQSSTDRLGRSFGREHRSDSLDLDPDLRRSYLRTQRRLDLQAARARKAFPQLTDDWGVDEPGTDAGEAGTEVTAADETKDDSDGGDDVSIGTFEAEIAQTSDMMEILEQIAGLQQQQLEHQRSQLLSETRGLFFGFAVSVAVIVAGVAPVVEASPHERRVILLWTAALCIVAGCVYAAVRARQSRPD
jgi:hypothetical protein